MTKSTNAWMILDGTDELLPHAGGATRKETIEQFVKLDSEPYTDKLWFWLEREDEGYRAIRVKITPIETISERSNGRNN